MLYFVFHIYSAAVFLRANVRLFGSPKLKLLAGWQVVSFACLLVRRRYITAQNAWMPRANGVRKKDLMRKFKNTMKNQCVDSNLCICNVAVRLPENGKKGGSNSLFGGFSTSEQKGIEQCKRKEKARILQDPGPILRSRLTPTTCLRNHTTPGQQTGQTTFIRVFPGNKEELAEEMTDEYEWKNPRPSRAIKIILKSSHGQFVVRMVINDSDEDPGQISVCGSLAEYRTRVIVLAEPDTVDVVELAGPMHWRDAKNKTRDHYLDHVVHEADGRRIGPTDKPYQRVTEEFGDEIRQVSGDRRDRSMVHELCLVTEYARDPDLRLNSTLDGYPENPPLTARARRMRVAQSCLVRSGLMIKRSDHLRHPARIPLSDFRSTKLPNDWDIEK